MHILHKIRLFLCQINSLEAIDLNIKPQFFLVKSLYFFDNIDEEYLLIYPQNHKIAIFFINNG